MPEVNRLSTASTSPTNRETSSARLLMIQCIGGQANLLCHQTAAEGMGNFLAEYGEQPLTCGFGEAGESNEQKIEHHHGDGYGLACGYANQ